MASLISPLLSKVTFFGADFCLDALCEVLYPLAQPFDLKLIQRRFAGFLQQIQVFGLALLELCDIGAGQGVLCIQGQICLLCHVHQFLHELPDVIQGAFLPYKFTSSSPGVVGFPSCGSPSWGSKSPSSTHVPWCRVRGGRRCLRPLTGPSLRCSTVCRRSLPAIKGFHSPSCLRCCLCASAPLAKLAIDLDTFNPLHTFAPVVQHFPDVFFKLLQAPHVRVVQIDLDLFFS